MKEQLNYTFRDQDIFEQLEDLFVNQKEKSDLDPTIYELTITDIKHLKISLQELFPKFGGLESILDAALETTDGTLNLDAVAITFPPTFRRDISQIDFKSFKKWAIGELEVSLDGIDENLYYSIQYLDNIFSNLVSKSLKMLRHQDFGTFYSTHSFEELESNYDSHNLQPFLRLLGLNDLYEQICKCILGMHLWSTIESILESFFKAFDSYNFVDNTLLVRSFHHYLKYLSNNLKIIQNLDIRKDVVNFATILLLRPYLPEHYNLKRPSTLLKSFLESDLYYASDPNYNTAFEWISKNLPQADQVPSAKKNSERHFQLRLKVNDDDLYKIFLSLAMITQSLEKVPGISIKLQHIETGSLKAVLQLSATDLVAEHELKAVLESAISILTQQDNKQLEIESNTVQQLPSTSLEVKEHIHTSKNIDFSQEEKRSSEMQDLEVAKMKAEIELLKIRKLREEMLLKNEKAKNIILLSQALAEGILQVNDLEIDISDAFVIRKSGSNFHSEGLGELFT